MIELYQEDPTHPRIRQPPKPQLKPPAPETADETIHSNPSSPDLTYEPEDTSNHPETQADDPTLDIADEPEDAVLLNPPENQNTTFDETRPQIGSRILLTTTL